jgi:hypothetical protein
MRMFVADADSGCCMFSTSMSLVLEVSREYIAALGHICGHQSTPSLTRIIYPRIMMLPYCVHRL